MLLEIKGRVEPELREDLASLRPEEAAVLSLLEARLKRTLTDALEDSLVAAKRKKQRRAAATARRSRATAERAAAAR